MYTPQPPEGVKIYAYDVNALYPFSMKIFEFPIGNPTYLRELIYNNLGRAIGTKAIRL